MYQFNRLSAVLSAFLLCLACASLHADTEELRLQVEDIEKAFAKTMADRDFVAFKMFLDAETVFYSAGEPLVGKQAVADAWAPFFDGDEPPFSWAPETVAVLESGRLALSAGPVLNSAGERIATFNSIWRRNDNGQWRIIFDKGYRYCEAPQADDQQQ